MYLNQITCKRLRNVSIFFARACIVALLFVKLSPCTLIWFLALTKIGSSVFLSGDLSVSVFFVFVFCRGKCARKKRLSVKSYKSENFIFQIYFFILPSFILYPFSLPYFLISFSHFLILIPSLIFPSSHSLFPFTFIILVALKSRKNLQPCCGPDIFLILLLPHFPLLLFTFFWVHASHGKTSSRAVVQTSFSSSFSLISLFPILFSPLLSFWVHISHGKTRSRAVVQ